MNAIPTRTVLVLSGSLLGVIGGALLVSPRDFLALSHVVINNDPGLLSELAAPSGLLIITGAFMILGAIRLRLASLALSAGALVYGSYGLCRLAGMALHGLPSDSLITATFVELVVAAVLTGFRMGAPKP